MHQPRPESFSRHDAVPALRMLTALEQRVVLLAKRDADRGAILPRRSRLSRFVTWLTGNEGPQPLADDRLETLRRFICFERRGDQRAANVATTLLGFGFSREALAGVSAIART